MRRTATWIMAGMLAASAPAWAAQGSASAARTGGDRVAVISGGVGEDSRQDLAAKAKDYNLKLVFALTSREYLADVQVDIADSKGASVASQLSEGPWMFVKLPPGTYTVKATVNDKSETKKITVGKQGQKTVNFLWPASAAATGAETKASR